MGLLPFQTPTKLNALFIEQWSVLISHDGSYLCLSRECHIDVRLLMQVQIFIYRFFLVAKFDYEPMLFG